MFVKKLKNPIRLTGYISAFMYCWMSCVGLFFSSGAMADSVYDYPRNADFVVIEYTQIDTMIKGADPVPLLRIYGDGTVAVHLPAYMKRAGDYEMRLSDGQLQQLLTSLEQKSILNLNSEKVTQLKQQAVLNRIQQSKTLVERSDDTYSVIKVRLSNYIPASTGVASSDFTHSVSLKNLKWSTRSYPDVPQLKSAAEAEDELSGYLVHPNLKKIK